MKGGLFATTAALIPGIRSAGCRSIARMRAAGHSERNIIPYSQLPGCMSEAYFARPLTLAGPSYRTCSLPSCFSSLGHSDIASLHQGGDQLDSATFWAA